MAEFPNPESLVEAARAAYTEGYRKMDAYAPLPVEGLADAIGFRKNAVAPSVFIGGLLGCIGGFSLMCWIAIVAYPHNVGGRPLYSWPAFIPITFECTVLLAALTAVLGMLAMNGLPQPYHPVFNVPQFARASRDRFFLCIEAIDPKFDFEGTRTFLAHLNPAEVSQVDK